MTTDSVLLAEIMETTTPFRHIPGPVRRELMKVLRLREMTGGASIFHQGGHVDAVYVIHSGGARLVNYTPDGTAITLSILAPGEVLGLMEVMQNAPALATAASIKDGLLVAMPASRFHQLTQRHTALSAVVSGYLTQYLTSGYSLIQELASKSVEERLACCVVRLVKKFGEETDMGWVIDLSLSRQFLAETIGSRLETVSRILRQWERAGWVVAGRESLIVVNMGAIWEISGEV
jgi:CRP-like cAMP-binding protein